MDAIHDMLHRLRLAYIGEIPTRLDEIEHLVMVLERDGYNEDDFNDLYRRIHSLKGSGGTHGVQIITAICHPFEDYLSAMTGEVKGSTTAFANVALAFFDLLRDAAAHLAQGQESFPDIETKLAMLRQRAFAPQFSALVVETASASIKFISQVLDKFNCRMVLMDDGYMALGRSLTEPFDLIITALEIPHLNGSALTAAIKLAKGPNSHTKCIMLTSNVQLKTSGPQPDFTLQKNASMLHKLESAVESVFSPAQ